MKRGETDLSIYILSFFCLGQFTLSPGDVRAGEPGKNSDFYL